MKTYIQIDLDNIQTSETHEDGSYTSGLVRRLETKTREVQDGTKEVKIGTEQVQIGTKEVKVGTEQVENGTKQVSIGFDEDNVELFETVPIFEDQDVFETIPTFETQDVFETRPKFIEVAFSPWDELDPELVTWLDVSVFEREKAEAAALADFKATRQRLIDTATVDANGHMFHADFWSKTQMSEAIAVLVDDGALDSDIVQWSLHGTPSGHMTDITLADLKLARKLAQINVSDVWGN
jgi:hypothetical protein